MFSIQDVCKRRLYIYAKNGELKRYGRVNNVVFHPSKPQALGLVIKRPDLALMVKRPERFVALDSVEWIDEGLVVKERDAAWDSAACRRLGADYESCVLWLYMPVRTKSGEKLGVVGDVLISSDDFKIDHIEVETNQANTLLLGGTSVPVDLIAGYRDGGIVVSDEALRFAEDGGAAAAAGEAWAIAKQKARDAAATAGEGVGVGLHKAGRVIGAAQGKIEQATGKHRTTQDDSSSDEKSDAVGTAAARVGRQLGRASGMFKSFKDEFDKASK